MPSASPTYPSATILDGRGGPAPSRNPSSEFGHFFTVDVEEHFQVSAFERVVPRDTWDRQPSRVAASTDALLALLDEHGATGTFFVLGWVADRHPALVRRIAALGHELASHGWWHYRVNTIDRTAFREEVRRSKGTIEAITGTAVDGFRAPSFSIVPGVEWAFDILAEEGYRYDSSIFPIRRPGYGYAGAPRRHHRLSLVSGELLELPMATLRFWPFTLPAAGGGYLRQLPLGLIRAALRQAGARGEPGMFYIHPWEVDPDQPRYRVGPLTRLRHYRGLRRTLPRLRALMTEFPFQSVRAWREGRTK
jgi:polysaccharide deacetylase family protein (PEP-CTERM system associated)